MSVKDIVEKLKDRDVLGARLGGHFRRVLNDTELASWKELEYEALDALEERVKALEQK